jgi:hypothetical protein
LSLASVLSVTNRLWLARRGGADTTRPLLDSATPPSRACGVFEDLLLCTDGLAAYPKQALKVLREPLRTGKRGRPRLLLPEGVMVAQALKRYAPRRTLATIPSRYNRDWRKLHARSSSVCGQDVASMAIRGSPVHPRASVGHAATGRR